MELTTVRARLSHPNGEPVVGGIVTANLLSVGVSHLDGLIDLMRLEAETDAEGVAELVLWPSDDSVNGAQYRVVARSSDGRKVLDELVTVVGSAEPINLTDILVLPPPSPKPYDEAAIAAITANRILSQQAAGTAIEQAAKTAADREQTEEDRAAVASDRARAETARTEAEGLYGDLNAVRQARSDSVSAAEQTADDRTHIDGQVDHVDAQRDHIDSQRSAVDIQTASVAADKASVSDMRDRVATDREAVEANATQVAADRDAVSADRSAVAASASAAGQSETKAADSAAIAGERSEHADAVAVHVDGQRSAIDTASSQVATDKDAVAADAAQVAADREHVDSQATRVDDQRAAVDLAAAQVSDDRQAVADDRQASEAAATDAAGSKTASANSALAASHWAMFPRDEPVPEGDGSQFSAMHWAKVAEERAVNSVVYQGIWDASTGAFPDEPVGASYWLVSGAPEGVTVNGLEFRNKDQLIWSPGDPGSWSKIDNTDAVSSVNGKRGAVELAHEDVGADPAGAAGGVADDLSALQGSLGTAATRDVGTEAGALIEVGAFGLGIQGADRVLDIDDPNETGVNRWFFTSDQTLGVFPNGGSGWFGKGITLCYGFNQSYTQLFFRTNEESDMYHRTYNGNAGVWGRWKNGFNQDNIVGNVSRNANGRIDGAIIESGENENGSYTKFADGTLICRGVDTIPYDTRLRCRLYKTMPAPFANDTGSVCVLPDWGSRGTKFNQAIPAGGLANNGYNAHLAFWAPDTSEFETTDSFPKTAWMAIGIAR